MTMAGADPARQSQLPGGDLMLRIASSIVLAPLALGFAYLGGLAFAAFWGVAAVLVMREWILLVSGSARRAALIIGLGSVALATALAASVAGAVDSSGVFGVTGAAIVLVAGMIAAAAIRPRKTGYWLAAGIPYAGLMGLAPIILRADAGLGFIAIVFLFAVVWTTDVAAYFVGRAVGGPKLAPRLSPKKTWSGSIGGLVGAALAAVLVVHLSGIGGAFAVVPIAVILSAVSQAGDLFESALKRRFGAKDSGSWIPGHGGLMDRLDGFVAAAVLACIVGVARGGIHAPAHGLLIW
jgi:phosphatidate cytidylyltransferase